MEGLLTHVSEADPEQIRLDFKVRWYCRFGVTRDFLCVAFPHDFTQYGGPFGLAEGGEDPLLLYQYARLAPFCALLDKY